MTRETKVGMVVTASFLTLVGVVIASKMRTPEAAAAEMQSTEQEPPALPVPVTSEPPKPPAQSEHPTDLPNERPETPAEPPAAPPVLPEKSTPTVPEAPPMAETPVEPPKTETPIAPPGEIVPEPVKTGVVAVPTMVEPATPAESAAPLPPPAPPKVEGAPDPLPMPAVPMSPGTPEPTPAAEKTPVAGPPDTIPNIAAVLPLPIVKEEKPPEKVEAAPPTAPVAATPLPESPLPTPAAPAVPVVPETPKLPEKPVIPVPAEVGIVPPMETPKPVPVPVVEPMPVTPPAVEPEKPKLAPAVPVADKIVPVPIPQTPPVVARANATRPAVIAVPEVVRFTEEEYHAQKGDTYARISKARFESDKFAEALRLYNQNDALQGPPLTEADGSIRAGAIVSIPELQILEKRYPNTLPYLQKSQGGNEASSEGAESRRVPIAGTPAQNPTFRVPARGLTMWQVAMQTLKQGNRYVDIARLNPGVPTDRNLPEGTVLVLPPDAEVPR